MRRLTHVLNLLLQKHPDYKRTIAVNQLAIRQLVRANQNLKLLLRDADPRDDDHKMSSLNKKSRYRLKCDEDSGNPDNATQPPKIGN